MPRKSAQTPLLRVIFKNMLNLYLLRKMYASVVPAPGVDKMSPEPSGLYDLVIYKGETEYPRHEV